MADQKVSDLPSLNGADVDAADLLYIIDSSAGSAGSKKITVGQYQLAPVSGGTANGVVYLNGSKVVTTGSGLVFDGSNLGVGTSSPSAKLEVASGKVLLSNGQSYAVKSSGGAVNDVIGLSAGNVLILGGGGATDSIQFWNQGLQRMTLDSSGNLGLGVTPSAWNASFKAYQVGNQSLWSTVAGNGYLTNNAFFNTSNAYVYRHDGFATEYIQSIVNGSHSWYTAPSGTAGNAITFTQAMTLDASGRLMVGTTAPNVSTARYNCFNAPTGTNVAGSFKNDGGSSAQTIEAWNAATTGNNVFISLATEGTFTERGSISYNRAGGLVAYNTTSDYRAKDIIGPVQNPGATIDALKVYEGRMKGATQSRPMLVAHEAQAAAPYAVSGVKDEVNEDGSPKYQQIDVSSLVPLLLAEIQSLRARVAALESA